MGEERAVWQKGTQLDSNRGRCGSMPCGVTIWLPRPLTTHNFYVCHILCTVIVTWFDIYPFPYLCCLCRKLIRPQRIFTGDGGVWWNSVQECQLRDNSRSFGCDAYLWFHRYFTLLQEEPGFSNTHRQLHSEPYVVYKLYLRNPWQLAPMLQNIKDLAKAR